MNALEHNNPSTLPTNLKSDIYKTKKIDFMKTSFPQTYNENRKQDINSAYINQFLSIMINHEKSNFPNYLADLITNF